MHNKILPSRRSPLWFVTIATFFVIWCLLHITMHDGSSLFPNYDPMSILASNNPDSASKIATPPLNPTLPGSFLSARNPKLTYVDGCSANHAKLKVYMYDLPLMFHFGLLEWGGNTIWPDVNVIRDIPRYPGGLNLQHSVEYWLTLDLLASNSTGITRPCFAVRVENSSQADVVFVPFFSSVSYNRYARIQNSEKISMNRYLQMELVRFLMGRDEWRRSGGKDHVIVAHHPNSMLYVRRKLRAAMFVLADFGRYSTVVANIDKDIIAPYRHVVKGVGNTSASFDERRTFVYFQGAIHRKDGGSIRLKLYNLLKNEKDVHFTSGVAGGLGINGASQGMAGSKFCLNIAGDTPSSNRLFDAIVSHCVPVIISDKIELPFEDVLDYAEFCIFVRSVDAIKAGFLMKLLRGIKREKWTKMWWRLREIAHHFEYQYPSRTGDAVQMIWEAITRKITSVSSTLHREKRLRMSQLVDHRY